MSASSRRILPLIEDNRHWRLAFLRRLCTVSSDMVMRGTPGDLCRRRRISDATSYIRRLKYERDGGGWKRDDFRTFDEGRAKLKRVRGEYSGRLEDVVEGIYTMD